MASWEPDEMIGQNEIDVRNEAKRAQHYEVSPREREDELRRDRHDEGLDPWGYHEDPSEEQIVRLGENEE